MVCCAKQRYRQRNSRALCGNDAQPFGRADRFRPAASSGGLPQTFGVTQTPVPRGIIVAMQITTGTVVGGKVVVEGVPLVEGSVVTVLSRQPGVPFALSAADEEELLEAIAEIERGEFETPEALLESLRKYG